MAYQYEDEDDDFGQKLPPLHIYLKRVLDKYPEGGQILKELVQNADDAGARRVIVVYDKTQHSTDTMWSESLHGFNGPSLYVYNDATFQEQDWKNIQHPEQSGKLDDPTKVGRFGLGFISVYHLTDIPSVLSGKQIGFLDPHEKYFEYDPHTRIKHRGKRGKKWRLSADILNQFPDQFNPYIEPLFNCSRASFENGCFDGTIFRFPLRNASMESHVSRAVYDDERMRSLFHSYQADADISLLFLKNIETFSLYEKIHGEEQPQLMFSVEVAEKDRMKLRSERKKFLQGVTLSTDVSSVCSMNIIKHSYENLQGMASSSNKYVTVNLVKKEGISIDLQNLMVDQDLKLLPWVGVAMRVYNDGKGGRVFCFLPLPESERTGLPIHVHGYFGLGDNRRSIKWPDRESEHDKAARWNQLLVHEAFPDAYMKLIMEAIDQGLPANDVYSAWPDLTNLKGEWKVGVKNFLDKIKQRNILHTNVNSGSWQKPDDVFINPNNDDLVHRLLIQKDYPVAKLPDHVKQALNWAGIQTKSVTPAIVRKAIKGDPLEWMTREEKLHILKYILEDEAFYDLSNIHLLPLENGTFARFSSSNATVFIATLDIPSDLFPNMSSRFAARDMPQVLHEAQYCTQLKCLTHQMVPTLLKEALPQDWVNGTGTVQWNPGAFQQPKKEWLEKIWTWLARNSISVPLTSFKYIPLVQLDVSGTYYRLATVNVHPLIYKQNPSSGWHIYNTTLPETMCTYLEKLGCVVIRNSLPTFIAQHPHIDKIIKSSDADGVTTVLNTSWSKHAIQYVAAGSNDLKRDIRNFFKHATLSDRCKTLLPLLPIFGTTDNLFVSLSKVQVTVPSGFHGIPISRLRQRCLLEKDDSDTLAMKLGGQRISEKDLLCSYILPDIENQYYDNTESTEIMSWVLEKPQFDSVVQNRRFVPTERGLKRPIDLFPPDDPRLKLFFTGEALFPIGRYSSGKLLHNLKRVGLREVSSITAQDILDIAVRVSHSKDRDGATELLEHIIEYPYLLTENVSRNRIKKPLGKFLRDRAWVPCKKVPPLSYPDTLNWYGSSVTLCRPEEVGLIDHADLVGSVKPLVEVNLVPDQLRDFFEWNTPNPKKYPVVEHVAQHLKNAAAAYQNTSDVYSMTRIVDAVYKVLSQAPERFIRNIFCDIDCFMIWHGNGFTTPNKIAFKSGTIRMDLAPYLYILPSTLNQYRTFLEAVGVKQQFTENALNEVLQIIQEKHQQTEVSISEQQTDLKLICDILNSIIAFASPNSSFVDVLVPCKNQPTDTKNTLKMTKSSECLYVDEERLMVEYNRGECHLPVVHEMVPNHTARRLGLRPLSHSVAPVDNVDLGYDVEGPHQSTVNAIKRNLEMYKEGVDIFKELIQNADDAGATEVKFLIDWRDNSQSANDLLSEGMEMCHGPALWAYNDSTFNEDDVKNICSIAAASKKDQLDKIGRFGLGFTSVYHITDVPSLCSGPFVLIFDPRTNHLGNRINSVRPGIKLDVRIPSHRATVRSYPNQFQPFQGIFNCDLPSSSNGFNKTLFRLPLRTEREVSDMSQDYLSKAIYNSQEKMTEMARTLKESAPSLLLFTQNVTKVSVLFLSADFTSTDDYKTLLDVSVENVKTLPRCIDSQDNIPAQRKILRATQQRMQTRSPTVPESTTVVKVTCKFLSTKKAAGNKILKSKEYLFIVSACMATGRIEDLARSMEGDRAGVLPCGGVAVLIGSGKGGRVPISLESLDKDQVSGGAFSYLPLNVYTGLPFHINGNFLLQPNRRHLWSKSSLALKAKQGGEFETRWNICFMEEVVCKALINLLVDLQTLQAEDYLNAEEFQTLWPKLQHAESDFHPLIAAFFQTLCNPDKEETPNIICNGNRWVTMHDCFFIEDALREVPVGDAIKVILSQRLYPKKYVHLEADVLQSMVNVGVNQSFDNNSYDLPRFLRDVYFPMVKNGEELPRKQQKEIMLHLLDLRIGTTKITEFDAQMKELDCFPASPDGEELTSPEQLIHPQKPIGQLFKEEDGRFPYGKDYRREERMLSLAELGMATDNLKWDDICERAESFEEDTSRQSQLDKCVILLSLIDKKLQADNVPTAQQSERLRTASFLPVLKKPYNYSMPWHKTRSLYMAASELFEGKHKYLVGSVQPLLDENCLGADGLSYRVKQFLEIGKKRPEVVDVIEQLKVVVEQRKPALADQICRAVYRFLNNIISRNDHRVVSPEILCHIEELKSMAFVHVDGKFLKCEQLAFEYKRRGGHYLYAVPDTLKTYNKLLQACGVKETFSFHDYLKVVEMLKRLYGDQPLSESDTAIAEDMLKAIAHLANDEDNQEGVLALDQNSVLRPLSELTYNDMSWTDPVKDVNYTHRSITEYEAKQLGIKTSRQLQLSTCSTGHGFEVKFGQKEELTTRLSGILREYSHKADALKELLQNADDAGATEIHIVYDPRINASAKIVGPLWKPMHESPALCVYNDRPFTESDLLGIQQVGVGGKISDATTTGRFGIGFNAVYHLTDCPTFVTNNDKLCVFDPHVKYIPGATTGNPGMLYTLQGSDGCLATFPDMICGYLGEYGFDLNKGTMFRFPLRTVAKNSDISHDTYTRTSVIDLLKEFELVAKESLLFLNSIEKISISEIDPSSKLLKSRYQITAKVSDEGMQYRKDLKDFSKQIQINSETLVSEIAERNWVYTMDVEDSQNRFETWLISQAFGIDEIEIKENRHFKTKVHLPRGGAAALLRVRQTVGDDNPFKRRYKAFALLPLQVYTGLPVHVNGTFELDQYRRNLVKGEDYGHGEASGEDLIQKWNNLLAVHVIGPAYARLIQAAGAILLDPTEENCKCQKQIYDRLFPTELNDLRGEWELVAKATLTYIGNNLLNVLPVVKVSDIDIKRMTVTWHHPVCETSKAVFNNLSFQLPIHESDTSFTKQCSASADRLGNFLLKIGFHLLSSKPGICRAFQAAGVNANFITPKSVMNHLSKIDCISDKYPCSVSESSFQNVENLRLVLKYCLKGAENPTELNGLPLQLTSDGILNVFSPTNGVYITRHLQVLPNLPELFIHQDLVIPLEASFMKSECLQQCYSSGFFKEFTLDELGLHLHKELPSEWQGCHWHIEWTPGINGHPSENWIKHLWHFILERYSRTSPDELHAVAEWPVYPTSGNLVSYQLSKTILYLDKFSDTDSRRSLTMILQKLGCPNVIVEKMGFCEGNHLDELSKLLETHLAVPTKQSDVLSVIRYMLDIEQFTLENKLTSSECDALLHYFQEACENGNDLSETDIKTLKRLPVFPAANSDRTMSIASISNCHTVKTCNLPTQEIDQIFAVAGCALLKANPMLQLLYKKLKIPPIKTPGIFLKYVLPNFQVLPQNIKLIYLEHIRDKVIKLASEQEVEATYFALKKIAFIPDVNGIVQTTDYFYDPSNEVFASMIEAKYLLPKMFDTQKWRGFLKHIGLQHVIDQKMFTKFVRQIADTASTISTHDDYKRLMKQSEILVEQLNCNKQLWDSTFLDNIADIKFIPSVPIDPELKEIHLPYSGNQKGGMSPFISYRGAVPEKFKELAWSVAMLLPSWAIPVQEHVLCDNQDRVIQRIQVHQCLGIEADIIMDKVISHIQKVCDHMAKRNAVDKVDTLSPSVRTKLTKVIKGMMKYLRNNLPQHRSGIQQRLSSTPICPVEKGAVLVQSRQLVFDLTMDAARCLRPYLFHAPRDFGEFDNLLRVLGAQSQMTFDQLANVLWYVEQKCDQNKMHPNEQRGAHMAVQCIFSLLYETEGKCPISVTELYLPTPDDKLRRSTDLYYADPRLMDRMALASTKLEFVVPLKQCGIAVGDTESHLIELLPRNIRPQNISSKMQEKPCETNEACPSEGLCPFLKHLKKIITSEEMQRVLLRLVQDQNDNGEPTGDQKRKIEHLSNFSNFQCVLMLKTGFYDVNDTLMIERKSSRKVYLMKMKNAYKLYFEHQDLHNKMGNRLFNPLAKNIGIICNLWLDDKHLWYLREVLECGNVDEMNEILTEYGISEYDIATCEKHPNVAIPGSIVPEDIRHLLDDDPFNLFHPDEIVVYKRPVEDKSFQSNDANIASGNSLQFENVKTSFNEDEEYYFVYAKIIGQVPSEDETDLRRRYSVDVGESKPIVVSILMLYKFRRPRKPTETRIALFTGDPDSEVPQPEEDESLPKDIEDAKVQISKAVKEALSLPESEQKEAIRRLYKRWHPDKNAPEKSQMYNEAFKFLKQELSRQKNGDSCNTYTSHYERWESDIQREREQERNYQKHYQERNYQKHYQERNYQKHYQERNYQKHYQERNYQKHYQERNYQKHYHEEFHEEFGNQTRTRNRSRRNRYHNSGGSYVPPSFSTETPDPRNARLWYRQAEKELSKAKEQHELGLNAPWLTAFMLHQVAEKALKAAKFYQNGKPNKTNTDLLSLVIDLSGVTRSKELTNVVSELTQLGVNFQEPRYPDSTTFTTSMERYADFPVQRALELSENVLAIVREMIGIHQF